MKTETKKTPYKVELRIDKKVFKGEDEDLIKALNKMGATRRDVIYKGIFTVKKGSKKIEKLMFNNQLKRFLTNDIAKISITKLWKSLLNDE